MAAAREDVAPIAHDRRASNAHRRTDRRAPLAYQSGFGNEFATEALPGALPVGQNSPQRVAYGLYAEQISGTAFTAPRAREPPHAGLYRIRPAAMHEPFDARDNGRIVSALRRRAGAAQPAALGPAADAGDADRLRRRPGHDGRQRQRRRR